MKPIFKIIIMAISLVVVAYVVLSYINSRPLSEEQAEKKIQNLVSKSIGKHSISDAIIYIDSGQTGISQTFIAGGYERNMPKTTVFHAASVGKAFTATVIGYLIDDGLVALDDKISDYLDAETLNNLFVFKGVDYSNQVTIRQLLNHTSGVADYFDDDAEGSLKIIELVLSDPDRFWTPNDLLDFSRNYQTALSEPGEGYHYSDTGYILLGLIVENVTQRSFDDVLKERIFEPLNMDDSYLMFYSEPKNENTVLADVWLDGVNIKEYSSLSMDWTGGGVCASAQDLAVFVRALNQGEIISEETLAMLYQFDHSYMRGIQYGNGFMAYQFEKFSPSLKLIPQYIGHMGILGTQMFYNIDTDTAYICSFGSADAPAYSVRTMIKVLSILGRIES